jgi:hypothetical protein
MRACDGGRRRVALGVIALAAGLALGSAGHAQEKGSIHFEMIVSHVSPEPGSIDPRAEELHRQIKGEIRYRSLRVIELRTFDLDLDEVGSLELPTGRKVRVRPLAVAESGVLVAVDIEGSMKTDLRVPNRRIVVIGGQPHEGGRLVISLEPRY